MISVIIPTLNEERYISNTIMSLKRQNNNEIEIIVVDANSKDRTRELAKSLGAKVIISKIKNPGIQRNIGAMKAKREILAFIDADTIVCKNWSTIVKDIFSDNKIIMATGPLYPIEGVDVGLYKIANFLQLILTKSNYPLFWGAHLIIRRDIFFKVGGFNKTLNTCEDHELSLKVRKYGKVVFDNRLVAYTSHRRFLNSRMKGIFTYIKNTVFFLKNIM
jgi:cellulose synthase/poly-beta-1,6-N-acetylglucosamine synthase-like glycosyltransferase